MACDTNSTGGSPSLVHAHWKYQFNPLDVHEIYRLTSVELYTEAARTGKATEFHNNTELITLRRAIFRP